MDRPANVRGWKGSPPAAASGHVPEAGGATRVRPPGAAAPASATGSIRSAWLARYPTSQTYTNASCATCHASNGQTNRYNAYGYAIKQRLDQGASNSAAFAAVEGLDSDQDPTGSTNLFEILNHAQPGWTPGAVNTTYTRGGSQTNNVSPPGTISGLFDPVVGLGANYCSPVANSTGAAGEISATGSDVAADNDVTLRASALPNGSFGF